jgi:ubiquinone/menaquinone biosynthesis C-methylase UbiE
MKKVVKKNIIKRIIPIQVINLIRNLNYTIQDNLDLLLKRRDKLTPPKRKIFVGAGDFNKIGNEFLKYFIELGNLKRDEKVLDIGCGIGRMAVPLTKYLYSNSTYDGIDISSEGISWCKKKITPKYPNFRFQLADMFNKRYNPNGKYKASEYKLPFENESFDFIFLTSVFTHMLPEDMENYFSEISRVLKKGGRSFITYFLLNEEALHHIRNGESRVDFKFEFGNYRTIDDKVPEDVIGYDEEFIMNLYDKYQMNIKKPIKYGSWCGRTKFLSYQDIIVATKL